MELDFLYYKFLLFSPGSKVTENGILSDFNGLQLTKRLLLFFKQWNSIDNINIENLLWNGNSVDLSIDHIKKTVDFLIIADRVRDFSSETTLKKLSEEIFTDYVSAVFFTWGEEWTVG